MQGKFVVNFSNGERKATIEKTGKKYLVTVNAPKARVSVSLPVYSLAEQVAKESIGLQAEYA